jgi:HEPN domain-containing protein
MAREGGPGLMSAQRLLEIEPMILDSACFHSQQSIEKNLKAYLIYQGKDIEKTHNIIFLLDECADFDPIFAFIDPGNINAYAVQGRYPDSNIIPNADEARYFYKLAIDVSLTVRERIVFV